MPTEEQVSQTRNRILNQLVLPMEAARTMLDTEDRAKQREWVEGAERRLWGASVVMSMVLGLGGRDPGNPIQDGDPIEQAWSALYQRIVAVKNTWPADMQTSHADATGEARKTTYNSVLEKLKTQGLVAADEAPAPAPARKATKLSDYGIRVKWSREFGFLDVQDPDTKEWHSIAKEDAPSTWRQQAQQQKEDAKKKLTVIE